MYTDMHAHAHPLAVWLAGRTSPASWISLSETDERYAALIRPCSLSFSHSHGSVLRYVMMSSKSFKARSELSHSAIMAIAVCTRTASDPLVFKKLNTFYGIIDNQWFLFSRSSRDFTQNSIHFCIRNDSYRTKETQRIFKLWKQSDLVQPSNRREKPASWINVCWVHKC